MPSADPTLDSKEKPDLPVWQGWESEDEEAPVPSAAPGLAASSTAEEKQRPEWDDNWPEWKKARYHWQEGQGRPPAR